MPTRVRPFKAIVAGAAASLAMLAVLYSMPWFGAPRLNIFGLLSTLTAEYSWYVEPLEFFGLAVIVFPVLYAALFYHNLPGKTPVQKGAVWGLILWMVRGLLVGPLMGEGLFSMHSDHAIAAALETLAGHLVYGVLLGVLYGAPKMPQAPVRRAPARIKTGARH
jgi:hypothetical protein